MKNKKDKQRIREFLRCLGNGKTIYQCESENDWIDELLYGEIKDDE